MLVDLFLVYQMIRRLATPFTEWKAFKTGVIDADGNIITPKENRSRDQKDSFGKYDLMILKLKKLLSKIPGGGTRIASYAAALWLIKEHNAFTESDSIESLTEEAMDESIQIFSETYSDYTTYLDDVNTKNELTELFDAVYSIRWKIKYDKLWDGVFNAASGPVYITFKRKPSNVWEIEFTDAEGNFEATNLGDQYKIIGTVLNAVSDLIQEVSPLKIVFEAAKNYSTGSDSRYKLYSKLVKKYAESVGYAFQAVNSDFEGLVKRFTLTRRTIHEDGVPANNVGGGAIAGLGIGPDGEPGVSRLAQRRIRKKNRKSFKDFAAAGCK